jgi:hypothetical protein
VTWGWSSPFYRDRGHRGGCCREVTTNVNGLMPLMAGGGLRSGFKGWNHGGGSKDIDLASLCKAGRCGLAGSGEERRQRGRAWAV